MANSLSSVMLDLRRQTDALARRQTELIAEIRRLREENAELRVDLEEKDRQLAKTRLDNEFLEVSHYLADTPDALILARRRISKLIRTIDTCVAMLKDGSV